MQRLNHLSSQVKKEKKHKIVDDPLAFLKLNELLKEEELQTMNLVGSLCRRHNQTIIKHVETATFPHEIIPDFKEAQIGTHFFDKPLGKGTSYTKQGLMYMEMSRTDTGIATFFAVQMSLLKYTIDKMGSEEQKKKYLPKIMNFEMIGGWALTEPEFGSDASSLETNVKKVEGGYLLNGNKRWIGNGNRDLLVVWARNQENKQIEGFIVENAWKGVKSEPIKNKLALRIVQNCQIQFDNVFVPDENKLPKAKDFQTGPNIVLAHSRVAIPWVSVGMMAGVYENVVKYITERRQFGKPLASFQLQQERIVRILTTFEAAFLLALRISRLADEGKATIGMISGVKAWITDQCRVVVRLGREMLGGNGIISDNYVMRAVTDAEVVYTFEGTYDINSMVTARELTGISAFK